MMYFLHSFIPKETFCNSLRENNFFDSWPKCICISKVGFEPEKLASNCDILVVEWFDNNSE